MGLAWIMVRVLSIDPNSDIKADQIIELDLGFRPSPAGSREVLLQTDDGDALLILLVNDMDHRPAGPAIVTFSRCQQSIFGYPNDEAQWGDPRLRERGYGFFEVRESPWPERLNTYNRQAFPDSTAHIPVRHFGVACHESLGEFLADNVRVELTEGSFEEAIQKALPRLLAGSTTSSRRVP